MGSIPGQERAHSLSQALEVLLILESLTLSVQYKSVKLLQRHVSVKSK